MHVKNGSKELKRYPQISRRVRDTLARLLFTTLHRPCPRGFSVHLTLRLICGYLLRSLLPCLTCIYETLLDLEIYTINEGGTGDWNGPRRRATATRATTTANRSTSCSSHHRVLARCPCQHICNQRRPAAAHRCLPPPQQPLHPVGAVDLRSVGLRSVGRHQPLLTLDQPGTVVRCTLAPQVLPSHFLQLPPIFVARES